MIEVLEKIKDLYGERMAKLCRELFPSLLEKGNLLLNIMKLKFYPNHSLYEDIVNKGLEEDFKFFIYSFVQDNQKTVVSDKSVRELFSLAGYDLYECHSEKEIQEFKKYYQPGEELCTFRGGRLNKCFVFWAVKKGADRLKREDFSNPTRQDEYGTSIISIQFSRGKQNTLSIKNRYNSRVYNPDATFSNNLENIIPGLTCAFEREYGLNIVRSMDTGFIDLLGNYVLGDDGRYYRKNYEINNIYYCSDNVIIDNGKTKKLDKSRYLLIDYFVIDLSEKTIRLYDQKIGDSFANSFVEIEKFLIEKDKENKIKRIIVFQKGKIPVVIEINKYGEIVTVRDENITKIGDRYLYLNKALLSIDVPKVESIGVAFLSSNELLRHINCESVIEIQGEFLFNNNSLETFDCKRLRSLGKNSFRKNKVLKQLNCHELTSIGNNVLSLNEVVQLVGGSKLETIGVNCSRRIREYFNKGEQNEKIRSGKYM